MVKPVQVLVEAYAGTRNSRKTWPPPHSSGTPRDDCAGHAAGGAGQRVFLSAGNDGHSDAAACSWPGMS